MDGRLPPTFARSVSDSRVRSVLGNMPPTTAPDLVARELAKQRQPRFSGSVWRLGAWRLRRSTVN